MLTDLQRDTFTLLGLMLAIFGTEAIAIDKLSVSKWYLVLALFSALAILVFGFWTAKGAILMIRQGWIDRNKSRSASSKAL